jgi:hypothetical protein
MSLNFNNNVDQPGTPNQASVGPNVLVPSVIPVGIAATTLIPRQGVVTRIDFTSASRIAQTAAQNLQFDTVAHQGWLPGDIVFIQLPSGAAFAVTVEDTAGNLLATWPATKANGGMFVYGAGVMLAGDFGAVIPGQSST